MTAAFTGTVLVTLLLLVLTLILSRCHGGDAAGCGMGQGLLEIGAYGLAILVGLLALLFCVRARVAKYAAFGLLIAIAVPVAIHLVFVVAENIEKAGIRG